MPDAAAGLLDGATGGHVAPGFELVATQFERNFSERGELGAAFAVVRNGQVVVDLWGGFADDRTRRPMDGDTLQLIFSGTKGLVAVCLALLIDRGELEIDAPVSRYWPEFRQNGKQGATVRQVVTHTVGMPGLATPIEFADILDDRQMALLLSRQGQFADPRAFKTYHPLTFGWLCGELIRRVDGRSVGAFFKDEVAQILDLDLHLGLPSGNEQRVARLELSRGWGARPPFDRKTVEDDELAKAVWANPAPLSSDVFPWNKPAFHQIEIPGANAIGTARAVAELFGGFAGLVSEEGLRVATTELERRYDPLLGVEHCFGVGFMLQSQIKAFGPPRVAFGHTGAGGSVHGAWPEQQIGFSYTMNLMRDEAPVDPRAQVLLDALWRCVLDESRGG